MILPDGSYLPSGSPYYEPRISYGDNDLCSCAQGEARKCDQRGCHTMICKWCGTECQCCTGKFFCEEHTVSSDLGELSHEIPVCFECLYDSMEDS